MEIILAENSGFCFGVKRALEKTLESVKMQEGTIHTLGPLIHNRQVIEYLETRRVYSADTMDEIPGGLLIIRSHGVPLKIYKEAERRAIRLVDATCPYVRKVQEIAKTEHGKGRQVVILGNPQHPEVVGINGWCENKAIAINNETDVDSISNYDKISVVAQTTLSMDKWDTLTAMILERSEDVALFNTICSATRNRQKSCVELARRADVMVIIGGYHSSNTQKLYELSKRHCRNSHHIETAEQLQSDWLEDAETVGIAAGASTPDWIINQVIKKIKIKVGS